MCFNNCSGSSVGSWSWCFLDTLPPTLEPIFLFPSSKNHAHLFALLPSLLKALVPFPGLILHPTLDVILINDVFLSNDVPVSAPARARAPLLLDAAPSVITSPSPAHRLSTRLRGHGFASSPFQLGLPSAYSKEFSRLSKSGVSLLSLRPESSSLHFYRDQKTRFFSPHSVLQIL